MDKGGWKPSRIGVDGVESYESQAPSSDSDRIVEPDVLTLSERHKESIDGGAISSSGIDGTLTASDAGVFRPEAITEARRGDFGPMRRSDVGEEDF